MKKIFAGFCAGLIFAAGATALAYSCDGDYCPVPEKTYKSSFNGDGYCYNGDNQTRRGRSCCGR